MTLARTTQQIVEVLRSGTPASRVTQQIVEVLRDNTSSTPPVLGSGGLQSREYGLSLPLLVERRGGDYGRYKYVIASHPVYEISPAIQVYMKSLDAWSEQWRPQVGSSQYVNYDETASHAWIDILTGTSNPAPFACRLFPTSANASYGSATGIMLAADEERSTKCTVIASSATYADVVFEFSQNGANEDEIWTNSLAVFNAIIPADASSSSPAWLNINRDRLDGGITGTYIDLWDGNSWLNVSSDTSWTDDENTIYKLRVDGTWDWLSPSDGVFWHLGSGPTNGDGRSFAVRIRFAGSGWTGGTTQVADINQVFLFLTHLWPKVYVPTSRFGKTRINASRIGTGRRRQGGINGTPQGRRDTVESSSSGDLLVAGAMDHIDRIGVKCTGRMYGSWIEGRSIGMIDGDPILGIAGIIESLLRDELGFTTAQIDTASFDTLHAWEETLSMRANLHLPPGSAIYSKDLIDGLCYEYGLFLIRSRDGKAKIFTHEDFLDDLGTIYPYDLVNGLPILQTTNTTTGFNELTVNWCRTEWDDAYRFQDEATDTSAQTLYGEQKKKINLDYIRLTDWSGGVDGDSRRWVDRFIDRLVGNAATSKASPEYLMSRPHALVTLDTIGHKFAHAEPGDYFALDSTTFDPVLKCWGESWSGKSFMVYETEVHEDKVVIKGLNWQPMPIS